MCGLCGNNCQLTINTFADGATFISGQPLRPARHRQGGHRGAEPLRIQAQADPGLQARPRQAGQDRAAPVPEYVGAAALLAHLLHQAGLRGVPQPLLQPGPVSEGAGTIPSDTACFPAKLAHGHIQFLAKLGLDAIFYPCMTYNLDEGLGDNHYNCPVVAYYPEVIAGNCPEVQQTKFIYDYVASTGPRTSPKDLPTILRSYFPDITKGEVKEATDAPTPSTPTTCPHPQGGRADHRPGPGRGPPDHRVGRPALSRGPGGQPRHRHSDYPRRAAVITEDSISNRVEKFPTTVLNQWTYHARLYAAARYCCTQRDMTWCSWSPSAAAWTPSPPTRHGRSCRRAASCTPS